MASKEGPNGNSSEQEVKQQDVESLYKCSARLWNFLPDNGGFGGERYLTIKGIDWNQVPEGICSALQPYLNPSGAFQVRARHYSEKNSVIVRVELKDFSFGFSIHGGVFQPFVNIPFFSKHPKDKETNKRVKSIEFLQQTTDFIRNALSG